MGCTTRRFSDTGHVRVSESEGTVLLYVFAFATAVAGLLQYPLWVALIGGSAIALVNIAEEAKLRARFAAIGASDVLITAHLASFAIGWAGGLAAWGVGRLCWWAFWS
jgi:hypothetical protein